MAISYKLKEESRDRMVFRQQNNALILSAIFIPIGTIAFVAGTYLALVRDYGEPLTVPAIMMASFGLAFGAAGVLMYLLRDGNPYELVFDNQAQVVWVRQRKRQQKQEVAIPYQDIARFSVRTHTKSSSSSSGGTRTRTYYIVFWQKHDSSIWDLRRFSRRAKAEAFAQKMEAFLAEIAPDTPSLKSDWKLPRAISRTTTQAGVRFSWRNTPQPSFLAFLFILLGFWGIAYVLFVSDMSIPFYIMAGLLTLITGLMLFDFYENLSTTYALQLSPTRLSFLKNDKEKKHLPMEDLAAVNFDFKDSIGGTPLRIMTHSQLEQFQRKEKPSLNDVLGLIKNALNLFQIKIDGLTVVEKVQLEHILQEELSRQGAKRVL